MSKWNSDPDELDTRIFRSLLVERQTDGNWRQYLGEHSRGDTRYRARVDGRDVPVDREYAAKLSDRGVPILTRAGEGWSG